MAYRICQFQGGPDDGNPHGVEEGQDTVYFSERPPAPSILEKPPEEPPVPAKVPFPRHRYLRSTVRPELFIYDGLDGQPQRPTQARRDADG